MGRYLRGIVNAELSGGTLAGKTLSSAPFPDTVDEETFVSSLVGIYSMSAFTPTADSSAMVGVAHADYSNAEIEEYIENTAGWTRGNLVQTREIGRRFIRQVGIFPSGSAVTETVTLNDGKPIKTKLNWTMTTGQTLRLWLYNAGTVAFLTAPQIDLRGYANLWSR